MHIDPANYTPFAPNGWRGIHQGAAIVFFAYIGFDAISTAAEETKNPQRNMPIGILGGLGDLHGHLRHRRHRARPGWCRISSCKARRSAGARARGRRAADRELDRRVRRRRLADRRAARVPVRPAAHLLRDGARRPAPGVGGARSIRSTGRRTSRRWSPASSSRSARSSPTRTRSTTSRTSARSSRSRSSASACWCCACKEPDRPRPFRCRSSGWSRWRARRACVFVMFGLPAHGVGAVRAAGSRSALVLYFVYGYRHSKLRRAASRAADSSAAARWHPDCRGVLDSSTRLLPGAFATLMLAELGADVIKIEDPRGGDPMRHLPPLVERPRHLRPAAQSRQEERRARSARIPAARPALDRLVATADVVVESFRPGTARRLGVSGADSSRARHPRARFTARSPATARPGRTPSGRDTISTTSRCPGLLAADRPDADRRCRACSSPTSAAAR